MMRIREFKKVLSELYFLRKTLKRYRKLLKNGRYYMFPTMRAMVVNQHSVLNEAKKYFDKKVAASARAFLIQQINKFGVYRNTAGNDNGYDAFYVANNFDEIREIKLFSFERKKILTICANNVDFINQSSWYEKMHLHYNMPHIEKKSSLDNSYEISMIELRPRPDEIFALNHILSATASFNEPHLCELKRVTVADMISVDYSNIEINGLMKELCKKISPDVMGVLIPWCEQHGDLSRDNLLYGISDGKTDFWWIDWEHLEQRPFFYDYFFYILNTALYFDDKSAFYSYINGDNNNELKKCFGILGMDFSEERLKDYFLIFAVVFLKERVCDIGGLNTLKSYCNLINELIS